MADSTEDIVPIGWEKRLSRSTGMCIIDYFSPCDASFSIDYYLGLLYKFLLYFWFIFY